MPVIRRKVAASTANALQGLRFSKQKRAAAVSLWASGAEVGDTLSFGVDDVLYMESAPANLEIANEVVDTSRDQLLFREPVAAGDYVLDITVTTDLSYLLNIETL